MAEEDEDKTTFVAGEGVYCYRKMPLGLKNTGATYQRLVDKVFNEKIGRNLKAYVDDMVIKSTSEEDMLTDIKETFQSGYKKQQQDLRNEEICGDFSNAHSANTWRSSNDVSHSFDRKHKRNFIYEKGRRTCSYLLRKQSPIGSRAQLPCIVKTHTSVGTRSEKAANIYFQAHTVAILTNSPIKQTLMKPEKSGRVAKWEIELGEHDIMFQARSNNNKETPKYFLIETPPKDNLNEVGRKTDTKLEETKPRCEWKLYTDGASSSDGSGACLMLIDPEGKKYTYALRFNFETTNSKAEYEALLAGLRIAQEMEIVNLTIFIDSQLLVNQIKGIYAAKQPAIKEYLQRTKETLRSFNNYTIEHIRRNQNKKADSLSKLASMTFKYLTKEVLVEVLVRMSIEEKEVLQVETKEEESWMTPIYEYLLSGLLLEDSKVSRNIRNKAPQYKLIRGNLYKKSFYTPWLHGIAPPKTNDVIKEIHEGSCGFNMEPCSMVVRITKQGYYWPLSIGINA
ncbi:reverse transcriptase domain-containing protein [Tanacetum coccineum]